MNTQTLNAFAFDQVPDGGTNERSFGTVGYSGDNYGIFWYGNDSWKIRPSLTINLGLRYEYHEHSVRMDPAEAEQHF